MSATRVTRSRRRVGWRWLVAAWVVLQTSPALAQEGTGGPAGADGTGEPPAEGTGAMAFEPEGTGLDTGPSEPDEPAPAGEAEATLEPGEAVGEIEAGQILPFDLLAPGQSEPSIESLRLLGRRLRQATELGRRRANGVVAVAQGYRVPTADPREAALSGEAASAEAAQVLSMTVAQLSLRDAVAARLAELEDRRVALAEALDDSRAAANRLHLEANVPLDPEDCSDGLCEARQLVRDVYRRLGRQATRDAAALERDLALADTAIAYLERRLETINQAAAVEEIGPSTISEEITRDQQRLDRETAVTQQVEVSARALERRAEEERQRAQQARNARLESIADELALVASELSRVVSARRLEEVRLSNLTAQREAFLARQAAIGERLAAIAGSQDDDPTRSERADRLYDSLFEERYEARRQVAAVRYNMRDQRRKIETLRAAVSRARGALELATTRQEADGDVHSRLVELRQTQVELAEQRLALEVLRLELQESWWQLIERQVYFHALSTDDLIPYLSDARRDRVYEFTGKNLFEAHQNIRDRIIGLSLVAKDRAARLGELVGWLTGVDGVIALSQVLVVLLLLLVLYRFLRRRRDRLLVRALKRLDTYAWVQRRIRLVLKLAEVLREATGPVLAYVAVVWTFSQIEEQLPELTLLRDTLLKLIWLVFLRRCIRVVILRRAQRREKGHDLALFGVDLFEMAPRTARLLAISFRVWVYYVILTSILIDVAQFLFGRGFTPNLFERLTWWGQLGLVYGLCYLWRNEIVEVFLRLSKTGEGRTSRFLRAHKDRIYSVFFLLVLAVYNLARLGYDLVRRRLLPRTVVRRMESFIFRKRIEMAKGTGETEPIASDHQLPQAYLDVLDDGDVSDQPDLAVERADQIERVLAALEQWRSHRQAGSICIFGEHGSGRTALLATLARRLPQDVETIQFAVDRRICDGGDACRMLARVLGVAESPDPDALVAVINERAPCAVLMDDCHNLFLRSVGGFRALDEVLNIVSLTGRTVFWVLTFNRFAWEYVTRVHDRSHHFKHIVRLGPMSEEQVQELVERRSRHAGVSPNFGSLLVTGRRTGADVYEVVKTSAGYYRLLTEFARGNPKVVLYFWQQSLVAKGDGAVDVVLFRKPDEDVLRQLSDRQLFTLTAIAQHERLTAKQVAQVVEVEEGLCELDVNYLSEVDLVVLDKAGRARLSIPYMRQVLARLQAANLLYHAD